MHIKIYHRRKMLIVAAFIVGIGLVLMGRLAYLMIFRSAYYQSQADALHERERSIKAARGLIYDRNHKKYTKLSIRYFCPNFFNGRIYSIPRYDSF